MSETAASVVVTDRAAARIAKIMSAEPEGAMLRVSVSGGGCSGFHYGFDIVTEREADDLVIAKDAATVIIDPASLEFLTGCQIDFVDELIGAAFKISNPNATASCGCGTSFAV